MKKFSNLFRLPVAVLSLFTLSARAQVTNAPPAVVATNATNMPPPAVVTNASATNVVGLIGLPKSWGDAFSAIGAGLADAAPYITNQIIDLEAGAIYNGTDKKGKFGSFLDLTVPITQQAGIGIGGAYLNAHWLDASVNARLGTTTTVPVIGKIYAYVSSGPCYDFQTRSIGAYDFAGFIKKFDIGKVFNHSSDITVGAAVGNISTLPGTCVAVGASWSINW